MNEEIQKWFTEHGKVIEAITIEDKASVVPGASLVQYTFEDGAKLSIRPAKYGADGQQTAAQDIVSRELPKPASATQSETQKNEAALNNERSWHEQQGHGRLTHAEWDTKQRQAAADKAAADKAATAAQPTRETVTVPGYPGWTATRVVTPATPTTPGSEKTTYTGPDGKTVDALPAKPDAPSAPDVKVVTGSDNKPYTITTTLGPGNVPRVVTADSNGNPVAAIPGKAESPYVQVTQDKDTGIWHGLKRDGTWEPMQGGPGAPQTPSGPRKPAPSLPQIVVGQSQDALRTAYTQIQEEVDSGRRTAAWGENRRQEVYGAAELAVREAQIIEQSRQANQTTGFNVANTVLGYGQSSLENALKFTLQINDKLKPGSGTGGKMFAALFNMQMAMAKASGIYDLGVKLGSSVGAPGQPAAPPSQPAAPAPRLSNPGDPAAVEADHQRSRAQLAASDAADAAAGPGGRAMTPSYGMPGQPSMPGIAPTVSGAPPVISPAAGTIPSAPAPGGPAVPPPVTMPSPAPPPGSPPPAPMPAAAPGPGFGDPGFTMDPSPIPGMPTPARHDLDLAPIPGMPTPARHDLDQGGFPALDALRQQFAPQPAAPQIDPTGGVTMPGMPPALQRAQIAATPPWRLNPADLESLIGQFGEETVLGWPGRNLVGGGG